MAERGQARLLATGSLAQQGAQVTGLLAMFAIVTVLARKLSLSELGAYGLLSSLAGYLLIVQNAAAGAAVRNMAAARGAAERDATFSVAATVYALAGLAAGVLVAAVGAGLVSAVDLRPGAAADARLGAVLLGAATAVGWPATVYRDALRAHQQYVRAAATEIAALLVYVAVVVGLVEGGAPLWAVIGASGTIPLLVGIGCFGVARASRLPYHLRPGAVTRGGVRGFLGLAGTLSVAEAIATAIYAVNRAILGLFRSAATVGLYEGPIRAHNLIRALNAAVTVTALPTAARYRTADDAARLRELLVRGSRYTLLLIAPIAAVGMLLASPLLDVWLGPRFREAGPAMAILLAHWLVNGCSGVLGAVVVGAGRPSDLARWAGAVGAGNLVLALALTPAIGLDGVAIATAVPYVLMFPYLSRRALTAADVGARELVREALVPAWIVAAAIAAALGALRLTTGIEGGGAVAAAGVGGLALAWGTAYAVVLRADERRLVRDVLSSLSRQRG